MLVECLYHKITRSDECVITIVIPTFNRLENLKLVLQNLNQIESDFKVVILDDCSSNFLNQSDFFKLKNICDLTIYRNTNFISGHSNLLRVIELSNTEWVLVLGDSKNLAKNSIEIIKNDIRLNENISGIVYSYDSCLKEDLTISSVHDLVKSGINFGDILLAGNGLYKKSYLINYLPIAQKYHHTFAPMAIFMLSGLLDGCQVRVSNKRIIANFIHKPESYNPPLQFLECMAGFPRLAELASDRKTSKLILKYINSNDDINHKLNFIKFCLIKIFKDKIAITNYLNDVLNYRYLYSIFSYEKIIIYILILISSIININKKI